jgi:hypothetical protein
MSNLDTRLRETLHRVAESTKVTRRVDEIVRVRQRRAIPKFAVGLTAFVAVVAVFSIPVFLGGSLDSDVAGSFSAPADAGVRVDPAWLTVEPEDVAAYNQLPLPGDGQRAPLRSEKIWCFYEDARPEEASVSGVAVDEAVTAENLTSTCATRTESAAEMDSPPQAMTICRGVFDSPSYQEWATSGEAKVITGDIAGSKPGFPVILGWQSDCTSESLETSPDTVTLTPDLSIDAINQARQLELAIVGAANKNCLSYAQSDALAAAVVEELGQGWMHTAFSSQSTAGACYQPFIDQQWGWVVTDLIRDEQGLQVTESTVAPTSP